MLRRTIGVILALACTSLPVASQDLIPDRRMTLSQDVDFYGGDLTNIFDTTLSACIRACLADSDCQAFTFNTRSAACFPKSNVSKSEPYEGAVSVRVTNTSPAELALAKTQRNAAPFLKDADLRAALDLAGSMATKYAANGFTTQQFVDSANNARGQNTPEVAIRFIGAALTQDDRSDLWVQYAQDALSAADKSDKLRREMRRLAILGAVNAYLRAPTPPASVNALTVLSRALEVSGRGRETIAPLRLAQALQPRDDTAKALARVVGLFGFSVSQTDVESNSADPRICVVFSENLSKGTDYAPFVQSQIQGVSVEAQGQQLCLTGLSHGTRYAFTLRRGLPAASGEVLEKNVEITQYVRDRAPSVRFPGRAYVLPSSGDAALPVVAVNATELDLTLFKVTDRNILQTMQDNIFARPLSAYDEQKFRSSMGVEVWSGKGAVETELNRDVTTRLPMRDIAGDMTPGVYALKASVPGPATEFSLPATQWFVISDLGVTTMQGVDGLHVFVRGLSDAAAQAGVSVSLLSRANAVLETVQTDADGYARFAPGLVKGTGSAAPGLLTLQADEDFAFLSLTDPEFDLPDRGVEGRPPAKPVDVFVTTERGAYRAGEVIHAIALARDGQAKAIADLPLTAILTRPDGVEYSRLTQADAGAGGRIFELAFGREVPRGTWDLSVYADPKAPALSQTLLLVEDFLPERIDATLTLPNGPLDMAAPATLDVSARYLFGAPGADLGLDGEVIVRAATQLDGYAGYRFGLHDAPFRTRRDYLGSGLRTDAQGTAQLSLALPELNEVMQPLTAEVLLRVRQGSNRPIERRISRPLTPDVTLIGVKSEFEDVVPEGGEAAFKIVALNENDPVQVKWTINRVRTDYQWYTSYGSWNWNPVTTRSRIATGELTLQNGTPQDIAVPVEWGEYEIKVERVAGEYSATSYMFSAGWYASASAAQTPDVLEASLDQDSYRSGETATLRIVPRHAGTALVSVLSNRLIDMKAVEVTEGENLIELPVTDAWGSGAYVSASVLRPMDAAAGQTPGRSLGLAHAKIDPEQAQLDVSLDLPATAKPRGPLTARVKVANAEPDTYAVLMAVDQGILNLTSFTPPDPSDHYFGQRKLGVGLRDLYGRLIDSSSGALGSVRSGGDAGAQMRAQSKPPTEDLVAYVSPPLKIDANGVAETVFDLPAFNGAVRVMAVAWSKNGVGQADAEVLVRDPVVASVTLPRFLAPGDDSQLLLELTHAQGPTGQIQLAFEAQGLEFVGARPAEVSLGEGETTRLQLPLTATGTGNAELKVALTTPDGQVLEQTHTLPIKRNDPVIQRRSQFNLAGQSTLTLDQNAFDGFVPDTASVTLAAGPLGRFDVPGLLNALDTYPYGCTEQITSRALPLLYLDQVARAMNLDARKDIAKRVDEAIVQVLTNQASNGAFGLWRPNRGDAWLDAYVTDFLARAIKAGYVVPDTAFRQALENLRNTINRASDFEEGGEGIAYALLVLAREGAAAIGDLRYYADVKADAFSTPLAAAQLGAALAAYGDPTRADALFRRAQMLLDGPVPNTAKWRSDYGTPLRDTAGILTLAIEAGTETFDLAQLSRRITPEQGQIGGQSTQESVWTLMAAHALIEAADGGLEINGTAVEGPLVQVLDQDTRLRPVAIQNTGDADTIVTLTTLGVPSDPLPAGGNGYKITRGYFDLDGAPVDATQVSSGTRLVAVLTVTPLAQQEARLMVNDPLPAGFEIDNPNLLRSGDVKALDWLDTSANIQNSEFLSDRFRAAVDHYGTQAFQLAYIVRAIAPGQYYQPPASVEDMYRPAFRARTGPSQVSVR